MQEMTKGYMHKNLENYVDLVKGGGRGGESGQEDEE